MDMDDVVSVVRALEPEFADDRGRLTRLEGRVDELRAFAPTLQEFVVQLEERVTLVEAYLSTATQPATVHHHGTGTMVGDMANSLAGRDIDPDVLMGVLNEWGIGVADYARFLRELKDDVDDDDDDD